MIKSYDLIKKIFWYFIHFFLFLFQHSPLFSQLLKPRPDLLAEVAAAQVGGGGNVEAVQRISALLAAAAAAAHQTGNSNSEHSNNQDQGKNSGNHGGDMKVPPINLHSGLPFTHDLLWR